MATILDGAVTVAITATGATPQLPDTSTPAFLCKLPTAVATVFASDVTRAYVSPADWVTDGGAVTDPAYYWLSSVFAQSPAPTQAKIIKSTGTYTQVSTFTCTDTTAGHTVGLQVVGTDGVVTSLYVVGSGTAATDATAIAALTDPTGCTVTAGGTAVVTITTSTADKQVYYQGIKGGSLLDNSGATAATNITTDLANAYLADAAWYGITSQWNDATNIAAVAAWALSNTKFASYTTADTANLTGGTGIGSTLKTAGNDRVLGLYSGTPITYGGTALACQLFTATAGSKTLAYKTIPGTAADTLNTTQITALETNNLCYYLANIAGVNTTFKGSGKMASGMWSDIRYGIDVLHGVQQINIFTLLSTKPKVPMDPKGIAEVGGEIRASLQQFTATDAAPAALLRSDPGYEWWVTLPAVSAISASDRSARILRNVKWGAYAQNAIQTVLVAGNVSV